MFCDVKVYGFALIAVLAGASCAPTDSENTNPIFDNPCVKKCPINEDYTPSCGTDGRDYFSDSYYTCFDNCGINIQKASEGRCDQRSKRSVQNTQDCMKSCPVTMDYNPFCGSDNETYPTTSFLTCFEKCGINVTEVSRGRCKLPSALENPCVKQCKVTADSSPFCGSDNNEYPTKSYLVCFESCGIKVRKLNDGQCEKELFINFKPQKSL